MNRQQLEDEVREFSRIIRRLGKANQTELKPRIVRKDISSEKLNERLSQMKTEVARLTKEHINPLEKTMEATKGYQAGERVRAALTAANAQKYDELSDLLESIRYEEDADARQEMYAELWSLANTVVTDRIGDFEEDTSEDTRLDGRTPF